MTDFSNIYYVFHINKAIITIASITQSVNIKRFVEFLSKYSYNESIKAGG